MAVRAEAEPRRRLHSLTADAAVVGQAVLIYFSVFTLATLQFLRHSLPSPDIVRTPFGVILISFELLVVAPALVLAVVDVLVARSDASGRRVRRLRTAAFAIAIILLARQLQLYFGPVGAFFETAAAVKAEFILFCLVSGALIVAASKWHDNARQFFQYAAPVALVVTIAAFLEMAPKSQLPGGYSEPTPAGNATEPPVFVIVMDEMGYELLADGDDIDAASFPNLAGLASHSAWLTNATTNYIHTSFILPGLIEATGKLAGDYRVREYDQYSYVESQIWDECGEVYTCRGSAQLSQDEQWPLIGTLVRRSLYQAAPAFVESTLGPLTGWLQGDLDAPAPNVDRLGIHTYTNRLFNEFLGDINAQSAHGTASFYHILLPHSPFVFNADGSTLTSKTEFDLEEPGKDSPAYARYREQMQYGDALIGRFIEKLKAEGIYDESVIIVTGDHGLRRYSINDPDAENDPTAPVTSEVTQVPFIVHAPSVTPGKYDVDYQHMDFSSTLMDVLGRPAVDGGGVSAFAEERPERDKVFFEDQNNERYWRYVYDEASDSWVMTEFVDAPLEAGGRNSPY